jgi:hypothetical protein
VGLSNGQTFGNLPAQAFSSSKLICCIYIDQTSMHLTWGEYRMAMGAKKSSSSSNVTLTRWGCIWYGKPCMQVLLRSTIVKYPSCTRRGWLSVANKVVSLGTKDATTNIWLLTELVHMKRLTKKRDKIPWLDHSQLNCHSVGLCTMILVVCMYIFEQGISFQRWDFT